MSHPEKYLVTSATGNTGDQVARQLLPNGRHVRVMSSTDNATIREFESRGAEVARGGLTDRHAMRQALSGIQRVYDCYPIVPKLLESTKIFAEEKLESVVNLGQ